MKKIVKISIFLFLFGFTLSKAQSPGWVINTPIDSEYYIGIGSSEKSNPNYLSFAAKRALASISEQIQINIKSNNEIFISEDKSGVDEDFFMTIRTNSNLELQDYEKYKNWEDKDKYFVYYRLSKSKYRENLLISYNLAIENATIKVKEAEANLYKNETSQAIRSYLDATKFLEPFVKNTFIKDKHAEVYNLWQKIKSDLVAVVNSFTLISTEKPIEIKKNQLFEKEFSISTLFKKGKDTYTIGQVPVRFDLSENINAFQKKIILSDQKGIANNKIKSIYNESLDYKINCTIDFENYFTGFGDYEILQQINFQDFASEKVIPIKVIPISVFIISDEQTQAKGNKFSLIKNQLTSELLKNNILVTKIPEKADYRIKIQSDTQNGTEYEGFFSSLLTVKYILQEISTNKTIYSGVVYDVKGVSLNYKSAAQQAYINFNEQIQEKLLNDLLIHIN